MSIYLYVALFLGLFQTSKKPVIFNVLVAFFLGGFASLFATWWIHPSHHVFPYFESDFLDYCYTLTTYEQPLDESGSAYRSRLAGFSSHILQGYLGTIDAIAVSSVIWTSICFSLLYLCGYFLHSSTAGIFIVMIALTIAPLHTLGRIVNFYPTIIASMLFGCTAFACWSRHINYKRSIILGIAIGLLLLVDLRGVLWATTYWLGAMLFVFATSPKRKWLKIFLCLHVPIFLSWYLGTWSYPPNTTPIEHQTSFVYKTVVWGTQHLQDKSLDGYVWGRSSLYSIIELFVFLFEESNRKPSLDAMGINLRDKAQYDEHMNILLYYASLPCLFLFRKPSRFITLLICVTPFALAWKGMQDSGMFQLRIYAQGTPLLAIMSGVSMGILIQGNPLKMIRIPHLGTLFLMLSVSFGLIWGYIPNSFAVNAPWHPKWFAKSDELHRINEMIVEQETVKIQDVRLIKCHAQIQKENQPWVRTYDYVYQKLKPLHPPKRQRRKPH
jgi:hypothetical protein